MAVFSFNKPPSSSNNNSTENFQTPKSLNGSGCDGSTATVKKNPQSIKSNMVRMNSVIRQLNFVKSDLNLTRSVLFPSFQSDATRRFATPGSQFNFAAAVASAKSASASVTSQPAVAQSSSPVLTANLRRRADIIETPQFAEVIRYVSSFENPWDVLRQLWTISDGEPSGEGLDFMMNYLNLLKYDLDTYPSEFAIEEVERPAN